MPPAPPPLVQTAEGALSEVGNMLQRMRELEVQRQNGTSSADTSNIVAEQGQLSAQIWTVRKDTSFNGNNLSGAPNVTTNRTFSVQAGANATARLGAMRNRLKSVVANLTGNATNLSDVRNRIGDTDYSAETSGLARARILTQASTAILAQATQSQQGVLTLLQ